jgi:hypothetical protein
MNAVRLKFRRRNVGGFMTGENANGFSFHVIMETAFRGIQKPYSCKIPLELETASQMGLKAFSHRGGQEACIRRCATEKVLILRRLQQPFELRNRRSRVSGLRFAGGLPAPLQTRFLTFGCWAHDKILRFLCLLGVKLIQRKHKETKITKNSSKYVRLAPPLFLWTIEASRRMIGKLNFTWLTLMTDYR